VITPPPRYRLAPTSERSAPIQVDWPQQHSQDAQAGLVPGPNTFVTVLLSAVLLLAACSSSNEPSSATGSTAPVSTPAADTGTGILPGYPTDADEFAPLIITTLGPDPIPFTGTDGKVHVTYELQVLNFAPRPATITKLQTLANGPDGDVRATMTHDDVVAVMLLVGDAPASPSPVIEIPPGRTALLMLDDVYEARVDVPDSVTHRMDATFGPVPPGQVEFAERYPTSISQIGGPVITSSASPVIIGPPVAGDGWWNANGCCAPSAHRAGLLPVGGRINGVERYAIDWIQIDVTAPGLVDEATGYPATFAGDPTINGSYLAYGEPLLAVADATVVKVADGRDDAPPRTILPGLGLDELGGNYVVLDIGGGVHAFYGHLISGSAEVEVGDRVTKGQVIGVLGNSGNSSEAHLHFHLMRSVTPLAGNNVPFEIEQFDLVGTAGADGLVVGANDGPRTDQLPLADTIVNFPPGP